MASSFNNFSFSFIFRSTPSSGPISNEILNDSFTEIVNDLAIINTEWSKLTTIIGGLPKGLLDTSVNAITNGLDGKTLWVDQSLVSTSTDLKFFNSLLDRPETVEEAFRTLYQYTDTQISLARTSIVNDAGGLTAAQKTSIGSNIFDSTQTSSSTSLDGKSENNRLNLLQIAKDLYGSATLDNDGVANLTNSVMAMVDALLELHNGNWDDDVALSHIGSVTVAQADVNSSAPGDDSYAGSPTTLINDLDQIRTNIKDLKGTGDWQTAHTALYAGGANSLEELFTVTAGSGVKSATNPWGYGWSDIDGLQTRIEAIRDFTGQSSPTDTSPTYSSTAYINNGDSLETATGKLDAQVNLNGTSLSTYLIVDGSRPMTGTFNLAGQDIQHVEDLQVGGNVTVSGDMEVLASGNGIVLLSDDGTRWRVGINDDGALVSVAI